VFYERLLDGLEFVTAPNVILIAESNNLSRTHTSCLFEILNAAEIVFVKAKRYWNGRFLREFLEQFASLIAGAVVTYDDLIRPARLAQYTSPLRGQKFRAVEGTHGNRDCHWGILTYLDTVSTACDSGWVLTLIDPPAIAGGTDCIQLKYLSLLDRLFCCETKTWLGCGVPVNKLGHVLGHRWSVFESMSGSATHEPHVFKLRMPVDQEIAV
jgi:hypothetical protein